MPVKIQCPNPACGKAGSVADKYIGKAVRCPQCKTRFEVPASAEQAAATAELGPETEEHVPGQPPENQPATEEHVPARLTGTAEHVPAEKTLKKTAKGATLSAGGSKSVSGSGAASQPLPSAIGRFQVLGMLGAGAFGAVYRAFDPQLDREVALKVPLAGSLDSSLRVERFLREAKSAAKLRHPNIVPIYEANQIEDTFFIASALIEGESLDKLIEAGPMDFRRAAQIVRALAEGLACAHEKDIVHRDVKPANIMIDNKGLPLLMDFGLAHHRQEAAARLTQAGTILGTPAYMPPEQAKGETDDPRPASDQYSLGVILFELLCGERPFKGSTEVVLLNTIHTPAPSPRVLNSAIPSELEQICLRTLSKQPAERFPSCQVLADSLGRWLDGEKREKAETQRSVSSSQVRPPLWNRPGLDRKPELASAENARPQFQPKKLAARKHGSRTMLVSSGVGIVLLIVAVIYFLWPRTQLPLDGTWIVQSMRVSGIDKLDATGITWIIQGDSLVTQGKTEKGAIKTDSTKDPDTIDVTEDVANPGLSAAGICKLEGDLLTICFGTRDGSRPTDFSSTTTNRQSLVVMKLQKP